jgi:hypothetical protein
MVLELPDAGNFLTFIKKMDKLNAPVKEREASKRPTTKNSCNIPGCDFSNQSLVNNLQSSWLHPSLLNPTMILNLQ